MRCTPRLASLLLLALACTPAWAQNTREAKSDAPGETDFMARSAAIEEKRRAEEARRRAAEC